MPRSCFLGYEKASRASVRAPVTKRQRQRKRPPRDAAAQHFLQVFARAGLLGAGTPCHPSLLKTEQLTLEGTQKDHGVKLLPGVTLRLCNLKDLLGC